MLSLLDVGTGSRSQLRCRVEGGNCAGSDRATQPVKIVHNTYCKQADAIAVLSGQLDVHLLFKHARNS